MNQGTKLGEGSAKEMIDTYKQVLVGQYTAPEEEQERLVDDEQLRNAAKSRSGAALKLSAGEQEAAEGSSEAVSTPEGLPSSSPSYES